MAKKSPTLVPGQHGQALEDRLASELQDASGSTALKMFPVSLKTGDLIFFFINLLQIPQIIRTIHPLGMQEELPPALT